MVNNAVETQVLRVVRGGNVVLRDLDVAVPAGSVTGLLGPSRLRQVHADARDRRRAGDRVGLGVRARPARGLGRPAAPDRLRHAVRERVRRPHRAREPALLRQGARCARGADPHLPGRRSTWSSSPTRWWAGCPAASGPGSRWRSRSSASPTWSSWTSRPSASTPCFASSCGARSTSWPGRRGGVRVQPRDGRGRALRPAAADARGRDHRRRHTRGAPPAHRHPGHRERVPVHRQGRGGHAMDPTDHSLRWRPPGDPKNHDPRILLAVAGRVLNQIRRDHRTLAMLLVLPCALMTLLWWMFDDLTVPGARPSPAGVVPVHHHVPGDQRDHAAGADVRHPRAAAGNADGQARLPRSATPSPSGWSRPSSRRSRWAFRPGARPRRAGAGLGADPGRDRRRRPRHRARALRLRVRPHRVPGRAVHAGGGDPADPAVRPVRARATQLPAVLGFISTCSRCRTPSTRCRVSPRTSR